MSSNSETPQPKQQEMTSISLSTGREGLIQLGVSLADISLLVEWGKKFGNFFQAARNDEDLFQALNEHQDALLKRRGLIELVRMKSKWSRLEFIYEGERKGGGRKAAKDAQELTAFAWLMVAVVAGLDLCCRDQIQGLLIRVMVIVLDHAFPAASGSLLKALEKLTQGMDATRKQWLHMYTGDEFLQRNDSTLPSRRQENMEPWLKYQSLVFGFYYQLFQPLLKFSVDKDTYFQGLWGYGSTTFLAMCSNFGQSLRSGENRVSRSHLLFMLATMLNGRQKRFNSGFASHGLLGILGPISILSMPLMCEVDRPEQIAQFMVVDLPIIDLAAGADGEVYTSPGTGISFDAQPVMSREIIPHAPTKFWSIHAKMGVSFEGGQSGVVMAAKCSGRLDLDKEASIPGFEITDEDWQKGCIPRPIQENVTNSFGVVHSCNCPALRYAATGFFATAGEEIVISTGDISAAFGRIEAQESGIIVA